MSAAPGGGPRILAGRFRGRVLLAPMGQTTRPTAARLRQAAFDMLLHAPWGGRAVLEGARVLDGFAGTGALGLEAYSRGAAQVVFIEQDRAALAALRRNAAACLAAGEAADRLQVLAGDFFALRPAGKFNLIFLDPPYGGDVLARAVARIYALGLAAPCAILVSESSRIDFINHPCLCLAERAHGAGRLSFWRLDAAADGSAAPQAGG